MKKEFWERVKWERIVDTRKYRYVLDDDKKATNRRPRHDSSY